MEEKQDTWFSKKGFIKNPFALEPLAIDEVQTPAFVDRTEARDELKKFVQEGSGAVIVISEIGYGKSSMMNLAEKYALNFNKIVLRIDPRSQNDKICFFKSLVREVLSKLKDKLSEEDFYYVDFFYKQGKEEDLQHILSILQNLFRENPTVLIMDDLDKILDFKKHVFFIKEIVDLLPKNIQVITTGDINQIMNSRIIVSILYDIFDFPILLEEITKTDQVKEFVYGRMNAVSSNKNEIIFEDKIFEILLDRTRGNLREVFRYLSSLLKTGDYSIGKLAETIIKVDGIRIYALDTKDKEILKILAGNSKDIDEIQKNLLEIGIKMSRQMIRTRLDELHQNCFVFKYKTKDSKKIIYQSPIFMKRMIELLKDSWSPDQVKV